MGEDKKRSGMISSEDNVQKPGTNVFRLHPKTQPKDNAATASLSTASAVQTQPKETENADANEVIRNDEDQTSSPPVDAPTATDAGALETTHLSTSIPLASEANDGEMEKRDKPQPDPAATSNKDDGLGAAGRGLSGLSGTPKESAQPKSTRPSAPAPIPTADGSSKRNPGRVNIDPDRKAGKGRPMGTRISDDVRFKRISETEDTDTDLLLDTDIASRRGRYVFTVGRPGSGKSTMQSHLTRYLYQSGDYIPRPVQAGDQEDQQRAVSKAVLDEWQRQWMANQFPDRTVSKHPSEFRFYMTPEKRRNKPIDFGYFEVAGEVYKRLLYSPDRAPNLPESLHKFLANQKCEFLFLFVCIGYEIEEDDLLFTSFLDYLYDKFGERYMRDSHIGIVISDPQSAIELLKLRRQESGQSGKLDKYAFIEEFLPTTTARLKGWNNDFGLAQFDVGGIALDDDEIPYIEEPSFVDARLLFNWIYKCFMNVDPEPGETIGTRISRWLQGFS